MTLNRRNWSLEGVFFKSGMMVRLVMCKHYIYC